MESPEDPPECCHLRQPANPLFYSVLRGYFWKSRHLQHLRDSYHRAGRVLQPSPPVREIVDKTLARARAAGPRFVLAVHKRVYTSGVAAIQLTLRVPEIEEFVIAARDALEEWAAPCEDSSVGEKERFAGCAVLLTSDDAGAPPVFAAACTPGGLLGGAVLVCREDVKRTTGGTCPDGTMNETHMIGEATLKDGYDAFADGLCLSGCEGLLHIDSSVAIFAAFRSPHLRMRDIGSLFSPSIDYRYVEPERLRVAHNPIVFVREKPSIAVGALSTLDYCTIVKTSGRWFGMWAELESGGWVLTNTSGVQMDIGATGELMVPVSSPKK